MCSAIGKVWYLVLHHSWHSSAGRTALAASRYQRNLLDAYEHVHCGRVHDVLDVYFTAGCVSCRAER